jgi:aryl-alcohol dehydrogenase-like predicted oxidoreductase
MIMLSSVRMTRSYNLARRFFLPAPCGMSMIPASRSVRSMASTSAVASGGTNTNSNDANNTTPPGRQFSADGDASGSTSSPILGATPSGTREHLQRAVDAQILHPDNIRKIGNTNLSVAALGFGAYKVGGSKQSYEALVKALGSGAVNLIDTSTHYGQRYPGESEELVGAALAQVISGGRKDSEASGGRSESESSSDSGTSGGSDTSERDTSARESHDSGHSMSERTGKLNATLKRENFVIMTKLGHMSNNPNRGAGEKSGGGEATTEPSAEDSEEKSPKLDELYSDIVKFGGGGSDSGSQSSSWHCLDPKFILDEFAQSCIRLRTTPDIVMLHNPEFFLAHSMQMGVPLHEAWQEMYCRLEKAFAVLEALKSAGQIQGERYFELNHSSKFFYMRNNNNNQRDICPTIHRS